MQSKFVKVPLFIEEKTKPEEKIYFQTNYKLSLLENTFPWLTIATSNQSTIIVIGKVPFTNKPNTREEKKQGELHLH